jgi:hypothetical protein
MGKKKGTNKKKSTADGGSGEKKISADDDIDWDNEIRESSAVHSNSIDALEPQEFIGKEIVLYGLKSEHLNFQCGTVTAIDTESSRLVVEGVRSASIKVKPENIALLSFEHGPKVIK